MQIIAIRTECKYMYIRKYMVRAHIIFYPQQNKAQHNGFNTYCISISYAKHKLNNISVKYKLFFSFSSFVNNIPHNVPRSLRTYCLQVASMKATFLWIRRSVHTYAVSVDRK